MSSLSIYTVTTYLVFTSDVFTSAERFGLVLTTLYLSCKIAILRREPRPTGGNLLLYLVWPGMDPRPFLGPRCPQRRWPWLFRGLTGVTVAVVGGIALSLASSGLGRYAVGWLGVAVILIAVHLGFADLLSGGLRRAGYPVRRLFRDPLLSRSLAEFWSRRWNLAYVELNQVLFLPPLRRWFGRGAVPAAFVLSGAVHELAISVPVLAGFGGPMAYFVLHALLTEPNGTCGSPTGRHRWPGCGPGSGCLPHCLCSSIPPSVTPSSSRCSGASLDVLPSLKGKAVKFRASGLVSTGDLGLVGR
jgi:alginate O-acetyltransferase complex protein AlgI